MKLALEKLNEQLRAEQDQGGSRVATSFSHNDIMAGFAATQQQLQHGKL
jgi:hypothetical protein